MKNNGYDRSENNINNGHSRGINTQRLMYIIIIIVYILLMKYLGLLQKDIVIITIVIGTIIPIIYPRTIDMVINTIVVMVSIYIIYQILVTGLIYLAAISLWYIAYILIERWYNNNK